MSSNCIGTQTTYAELGYALATNPIRTLTIAAAGSPRVRRQSPGTVSARRVVTRRKHDGHGACMIPIHELLNRIRWDPEFARGNFQLGYYDRTEDRVVLVPFQDVSFRPESPQSFQISDSEGRTHHVPFHRVREVYRDSQRIWHRPRRETK